MRSRDIILSYVEELLKNPVSSNMRTDPPTVSPSDPVAEAVIKMSEEDIGAVIVVEDGRAIGMITEKDILERVVKPKKMMDLTQVRDVMTTPLASIDADKTTKQALDLMHFKDIRRLAIMEEGKLIGIVTERRLLESALTKK
jgi:CBS domain-containing protein